LHVNETHLKSIKEPLEFDCRVTMRDSSEIAVKAPYIIFFKEVVDAKSKIYIFT
jgi:hypothetical protein